MAKVAFPLQSFTYVSGAPLALGSLLISLTTDCQSTSATQICAGAAATVPLDVNGVIVGSPTFWPNADLLPPDSMYVVKVYSADGQLVSTIFQTV